MTRTIQIPAVAVRRPEDPEPDLTAMYVIHRAMLGDLRRLAEDHGGGDAAIRRYATLLLFEVDHHHTNEDDLLWPVIERAAGRAVDLAPFTDDHLALEAVLARCRAALTGDLKRLRQSLGELHAMLVEHIADEESEVFPIIKRFVPADAYQWCEDRIARRAGLGQMRFTVPWLSSWASSEELDGMLRRVGSRFRLALALTRGRYQRLERAAIALPRPTP
ncbi:hemerythrin domain-containing protein [Nonomuraea sp. NPDC004297]